MMIRRKFIISLVSLAYAPIFFKLIKNKGKDEIFKKFVMKIENKYNCISVSKLEQNNFCKSIIREEYSDLNDLKIVVKNKVISDYVNNRLILVKNRYLSETEFYLYSLKS